MDSEVGVWYAFEAVARGELAADGFRGVAAFDGNGIYSTTASSDDGVGTSVCKNISSDQLTLLHDGDTVLQQASFTEFNADGAEFNYSIPASGGTARMWFALFTAASASESAALSGTITSSTLETDIVSGGKTVILTLTGTTWLAADTGPIGSEANSQAIIDGIDSAQAEANGWDAVVKANLLTSAITRTSATVATITLPVFGPYSITATETITATIPAEAIAGASPIVASTTPTVEPVPALSSPAVGSITATGGTFTIVTDETTGTAYGVVDELSIKPDVAEIQAGENGDGLAADWDDSDGSIGSSPITFTVTGLTHNTGYFAFAQQQNADTNDSTVTDGINFTTLEITCALSGDAASNLTEAQVVAGGKTIILTLTNDTWAATLGADNGITDALIAGIDSDKAEAAGWDAEVKGNMVFGDITRTSATVCTIILAAEAAYDITANETITITIPATAMVLNGDALEVSSTFNVTATTTGGAGGMAAPIAQSIIRKQRKKRRKHDTHDQDDDVRKALEDLGL